ncbi:MAG: DUF2332 family protein [Pseudomonadota bacterium]
MTPRETFREQARVCAQMGSAFMGDLLALAAERLSDATPIGARLLNWPTDASAGGDAIALRFAAGLHALKLDGEPGLVATYPPKPFDADALWDAVEHVMETQPGPLHAWLDRPPQTNEPRRSAALVLGLASLAAEGLDQIHLRELGASAGVNLMADHIAVNLGAQRIGAASPALILTPDLNGTPGALAPYRVLSAEGCDRTPLRLDSAQDQRALLSYTWPDQPERQARLSTLFAQAEAEGPPVVAVADAGDWVGDQLAARPSEGTLVIWHSIFWQYPPEATRTAMRAQIEAAGQAARDPLAWLRLEPDGQGPGAAITLDLWRPGTARETRVLARAGYHGEWLAF